MAKRVTPEMERINRKIGRRKSKRYSFWGDVWHRLCRNPVTLAAMILTAALILSGVCRISDSAVVTRSPNAFTSL